MRVEVNHFVDKKCASDIINSSHPTNYEEKELGSIPIKLGKLWLEVGY